MGRLWGLRAAGWASVAICLAGEGEGRAQPQSWGDLDRRRGAGRRSLSAAAWDLWLHCVPACPPHWCRRCLVLGKRALPAPP